MRQGVTGGPPHFAIVNVDAAGQAARFVERYWSVTWDLPPGARHDQPIVSHPGVTVIFSPTWGTVFGLVTGVPTLSLEGSGTMCGALFRPAGFRPFLGRSVATINDRELRFDEVFAADASLLIDALGDIDLWIARFEEVLLRAAPHPPHRSEATSDIAEFTRDNRHVVRVDDLAARAGVSVRQLERRFLDHIGLGPKALIRRYRLQDIAERARVGPTDWAAAAAELGYSDQAHLTRDFTAVVGVPPGSFQRAAASSVDIADTRLRFRRN
jgi:AraC-like DNA-binding protein